MASVGPKRILIIDDEVEFVDTVKMVLEPHGYEVISAYDGETGLDKAVKENPDLILLDIIMPFLNGFEVLRRLKFDSRTAHIPVVILTAKTDKEYISATAKLGAADYIVKPAGMEALIELIKKYI